ncbi:MAG TPA: M14 family metallopeptidase [bacterium]|nr:M14 family metallopeptidase [bacterium]
MMPEGLGRPGSKTCSTLAFEHPALAGLSWPYISVRGTADGPTLCITAGMHGSEYAGIEAALRLADELEPNRVHGHVLVFPVLNQPAFWERVAAVVPLDGKNPSRVFPGRRDGTVTEVMAAYLFDEIFSRCDALIDLHGGDLMERLTPFTIYQQTDDPALDAKSHALAASYGFPIAVRRSKDVLRRPVPGYMQAAAAARGIPAIVAEAGGEDQAKAEDVAAHLDGLRRALAHLGMVAGATPGPPLRLVEFVLVLAERDGLFAWTVDLRERVRAKQVIGRLRDLWGRSIQEIVAPVDAEVLFFNTSMAARKGQLLFGLGAPVAEG